MYPDYNACNLYIVSEKLSVSHYSLIRDIYWSGLRFYFYEFTVVIVTGLINIKITQPRLDWRVVFADKGNKAFSYRQSQMPHLRIVFTHKVYGNI